MNFFQKFIDSRILGVLFVAVAGTAGAQSTPPSTVDASFIQSTRGIADCRYRTIGRHCGFQFLSELAEQLASDASR